MAKRDQDEEGAAVRTCAREGDERGLAALIARGAPLDAKDGMGRTAAMWAADFGHAGCLAALVKAGAKVAARSNDKWSALDFSVKGGHLDCIEALLAPGAKAKGQGGKRPLVDAADALGHTALMVAISGKQEEALRALIEAGADLERVDKDGDTALFWACGKCDGDGYPAGARMLLAAGADKERVDGRGRTAAMVAAGEGALACLQELWGAGADLGRKTGDGMAARDFAQGHAEVAKWLDAVALSKEERAELSRAAGDGGGKAGPERAKRRARI